MKNYLVKIRLYFLAHKMMGSIIIIIVVGIGYWGYKKINGATGETRYVLSAVTKNTIISAVDGSGQVSALNQVTINPTVSGALTAVKVSPGESVSQGEILFDIDDTTAQKAVRDAKIGLQNANLALQKLQLQNSDTNLSTTLSNSYNDGFNAVTSTVYDLNSALTGLNTMLNSQTLSDNASRAAGDTGFNYRQDAIGTYYAAMTAFQQNSSDLAKLNNTSPESDIDNIIEETYKTTELLSDATKSATSFVNFMAQNANRASDFTSDQTTLSGYTNTVNSDLNNLLSTQTNISSAKDAFPSNNLDTQSAQIAITQAQNSLTDAEQNLSYYHITAPFGGIIASVPVIVGDNASSGTTLATIITTKELATVTLNEVDVAKIALGDKATLTFTAVPDLTIAGQVAEIDSVGTVSQGVVNYNVQVSFDTNGDNRVKPGMSVDAEIVTKVDQDVLTVPNSAIKTQGGSSYVQMFDTPLPAPAAGVQGSVSAVPPRNQIVTVGISDATSTEITSGLKEGDEVVTKTVTSTTKTTTTTTTPTILGGGATGGRGGGGFRIGG